MLNDFQKTSKKIRLIVEGSNGSLMGRVFYDDNLIVDEANTVEELENNLKKILFDFHQLDEKSIEFQIEYDLTAFFEQFDYLKITKIAELSGLNGSLLRQYASGKKFPSAKQVEKIEGAVKQILKQLSNVRIYTH